MSDFGVRINTAAGYCQIDAKHIVPQLVGRFDMANYSYGDMTDANGAQPGWVMRSYSFQLPASIASRPVMVFFSLPANGQDVYTDGFNVMYKPGATFSAPVLYVFALDYVTRSGASWGIRVMRSNGSVTYDSGNGHLNLWYIYSALNISVDYDDVAHASKSIVTNISVPAKGMPATPAICPQAFTRFTSWGRRLQNSGEDTCRLFYRFYGGALQAVMLRTEYQITNEAPPDTSYSNFYISKSNSFTIFVADRYIYD
ncbi:hypothetical protein GM658_12605 [Pseudoduganella eburnea]|uniref:Uncharacterized protein n=1 Tax=Massilia eburnea TaxID=1776165 RepID=A0A6L6QG32_9BURK|nr:hypothetical protein [Massilia eburnea]MTW11438.1 hypothetical protein [Massilia eburnea]